MTFVNPERMAYARILRDQGYGWRTIVGMTGISLYHLRCEMIPGYREHKANLCREAEARRKGVPRSMRRRRVARRPKGEENAPRGISGKFDRHYTRLEVPEATEAEWKRRLELAVQERDFTAEFCGDPLPGYSALERRK